MMEFTLCVYQYLVSVVVSLIYFSSVRCQPIVIQLDTTTPKVYKERFPLNKQSQTIPLNSSFNNSRMDLLDAFRPHFKIDSQNNQFEFERSKPLDKVKAVNLGEKTMRQSQNGDDDDDYDDGEYSGLGCGKNQKESVPLMLIHEMDLLAMEIPVKGKDKNEEKKNENEKDKEQNKICSGDVNSNNINVGRESVRWKPKAQSRVRLAHGLSNKGEVFGMGDREGMEDRKTRIWGSGMCTNAEKRAVMNGLDGRRDLGYILDSKRKAPNESGQRMKGFHYIY